jgi:hypothetical protein
LIISKNEIKVPGTKVSFLPERKGKDDYLGKSEKYKSIPDLGNYCPGIGNEEGREESNQFCSR